MTFEPEVSLTRKLSIGELLEEAAKELPEMSQDGVTLGVKLEDKTTTVIGKVTVKDFEGTVLAEFTREGVKSATGLVTWKF